MPRLLHAAPPLAAAALITLAAAYLGLTTGLGAHPFWQMKVAWIGAPLGLVLAVAAGRLSKRTAIIAFAVLTLAAFGAAHYGKTAFAASYAEDRLAGRMWYFGWIGTATLFTATVATLLRRK